MKFKYIHLYSDPITKKLDLSYVCDEVSRIFSNCDIDIRPPFLQCNVNSKNLDMIAENIASIRISEIRQPYYNQPEIRQRPIADRIIYEKNLILANQASLQRPQTNLILYDGFMMQRLLATLIPKNENSTDNIHIVFDSRLTCTFSEETGIDVDNSNNNRDDWRYHGRAIVCGTPSIISTTGIVEAPAKPKQFYLKQIQFSASRLNFSLEELKKEFAGKYIDYDDPQINFAATGYVLQSLFFFLTDGYPFCEEKDCRLFNTHWQEDLINCQIKNQKLCRRHLLLLEKFVRK